MIKHGFVIAIVLQSPATRVCEIRNMSSSKPVDITIISDGDAGHQIMIHLFYPDLSFNVRSSML